MLGRSFYRVTCCLAVDEAGLVPCGEGDARRLLRRFIDSTGLAAACNRGGILGMADHDGRSVLHPPETPISVLWADPARSYAVQLLATLPSGRASQCVSVETGPVAAASLHGTVAGMAVLHSKATWGDVVSALAADVLRSLRARCERMRMAECARDRRSSDCYAMPTRMVCLAAGVLPLCDYASDDGRCNADECTRRLGAVFGTRFVSESRCEMLEELSTCLMASKWHAIFHGRDATPAAPVPPFTAAAHADSDSPVPAHAAAGLTSAVPAPGRTAAQPRRTAWLLSLLVGVLAVLAMLVWTRSGARSVLERIHASPGEDVA